jgi:hypothetical protein
MNRSTQTVAFAASAQPVVGGTVVSCPPDGEPFGHPASRVNSADPALASVPRSAAGTAGQLPLSPPGPRVRESQHPRPCAYAHVAHAPDDGRVRDGQMARRVRLAAALRPRAG